jgi:putative (di)nucleoside polyphosphate hydrolase
MAEKLRNNVLGVVLDENDNVLIVSRANDPLHWQFPQGGVHEDEPEEEAILRELTEELGSGDFEMITVCPEKHSYRWAENLIRDEHVGQEQTIFILRFVGNSKDIELDQRELGGFLWVHPSQVSIFLHEYRQPVWDIARKYLPNQV